MKLIVLTGSSRGLGYAMYEQLRCKKGVRLLCVSRNITDDQSSLLAKSECSFSFIEKDFSNAGDDDFESSLGTQIEEMLGDAVFDEIIFISNSGIIDPIGMVGHLNNDEIKQALNVNFLAPVFISQVLVRLADKYSVKLKILNISSGAAKHAIAGWSLYCATKSAMLMFFDVMDRMPQCQVVHVDPGVLDTEMQKKIRHSNQDDFPEVQAFRTLQTKGQLVEPSVVAKDIIEKNIDL